MLTKRDRLNEAIDVRTISSMIETTIVESQHTLTAFAVEEDVSHSHSLDVCRK